MDFSLARQGAEAQLPFIEGRILNESRVQEIRTLGSKSENVDKAETEEPA